jgi:hypothetical protein
VVERLADLPDVVGSLAEAADDPRAEILAMVWGPRFDREHALSLLMRLPRADATSVHAIHAFADRFDALAPHGQQALRESVLRLADNAACTASC